MAITDSRLTLEDFLRLPEAKPALEYVDGEVRQKMSPRLPHSALQLHLGTYFNRVGVPKKIARAFTELRCTFAGHSRVPDLSVFRWPRIPRDERGKLQTDECFVPPDIAVEIRSPGQTIAALTRDCEWYVANGVALALLVLTTRESVRLFLPGQPWRELKRDEAIDFGPVIPGARLTVRDLFAALDAD